MTGYLRFINRRSIVTQMIAVVLAAVILGTVCTSVAFLFLSDGWHNEGDFKLVAVSAAARIATIAEEARQSSSVRELKKIMSGSRWLDMHIEIVPSSVFFPSREFTSAERRQAPDNNFADELQNELLSHWNLPASDISISAGNSVVVKINDQYALIFQTTHRPPMQRFIFIQLGFVVVTVMIVVLFLAVYIIKRLMAPLSSIAAAADALGHVSTQAQPISDAGPQEVSQVAKALNHLHGRLQSLIEERTRMLAAISHDLRTPLTRLRLKLERGVRSAELGGMIDEIEIIDNMISETLHYLREQNDRRAGYVIDMPSLIQTVCNEFADMGFDIRYCGPARMAFFCEELGMRRALSNVIDNAIKHGTEVVVLLESRGEGGFEIQISDNGPGIPKEHRAKVLEPFYVADDARSLIGRSGFGLGLSIVRDVVSRHRGTISFADNAPSGLVVRLSFNQSRLEEFAS
ncbi:sensor histidine kinase [Rhizobium sp. NPDC090279]|uniref:sensor histidine kinase n=1 Tax=Rhizobium sp. NPDC090279 TaxID=3364499 RepID=UPI00383AF6F2